MPITDQNTATTLTFVKIIYIAIQQGNLPRETRGYRVTINYSAFQRKILIFA